MNANEFAMEIAKLEKGKKETSLAQIKEILKITRQIVLKESGKDIYRMVR